ncbi:MAG TPA: acetoin dehydrogenase [Clostridiales bacterium]|nr:acetoin dehydrogenase [Clostridiales bacterium]
MFVRSRMSRDYVCVSPEDSLAKVYAIVKEKSFEGLPVVADGKVVGVVTTWDILSRLAETDRTEEYLRETKVAEVMTDQPLTIREDEIIEEAARIMYQKEIDLLPVVDENDRVVGVITEPDFFKVFVEMLGLERPGTRISLVVPERVGQLAKVTEIVKRHGVNIISLVTFEPGRPFGDVVLRVDTVESKPIVDDLVEAGFRVLHVSQVWA